MTSDTNSSGSNVWKWVGCGGCGCIGLPLMTLVLIFGVFIAVGLSRMDTLETEVRQTTSNFIEDIEEGRTDEAWARANETLRSTQSTAQREALSERIAEVAKHKERTEIRTGVSFKHAFPGTLDESDEPLSALFEYRDGQEERIYRCAAQMRQTGDGTDETNALEITAFNCSFRRVEYRDGEAPETVARKLAAYPAPEAQPDTAERFAGEFLERLEQGELREAYAMFHPKFRKKLPFEKARGHLEKARRFHRADGEVAFKRLQMPKPYKTWLRDGDHVAQYHLKVTYPDRSSSLKLKLLQDYDAGAPAGKRGGDFHLLTTVIQRVQ